MDEEEIIITPEEYDAAVELFRSAYPAFINEIDRIEMERGKLNDFQLMLAVTRAKEGLVILGWDCRKTVNTIFDTYVDIYRVRGRAEADKWAEDTFGCSSLVMFFPHQSLVKDEHTENQGVKEKIAELTRQLNEKEAELLHIYRELYRLQAAEIRDAAIVEVNTNVVVSSNEQDEDNAPK